MNGFGNNYYNNNSPYQNNFNQIQPQFPTLNGKIVDGIEVAKATDIPMGGYGVFPKADLSEIYVKSWDINTGKVNLLLYKPAPIETKIEADNKQLLEKVNELERKVESLMAQKEVSANAY